MVIDRLTRNLLLSMTFAGLAIAPAMAQSTASTSEYVQTEGNSNSPRDLKGLEFTVGYESLASISRTDSDSLDTSGYGVSLGLGKIFNLEQNFSTTTILRGSYNNFDNEDSFTRYRGYDVGLAQKFSLNVETSSAVIRPFVEGGLSLGRLNTKGSIISTSSNIGFEIDNNYYRLQAGVGLEFDLGGAIPFIKYNYSYLNLSDDADVTITENGASVSGDVQFADGSFANLNAQSLTLGVALVF